MIAQLHDAFPLDLVTPSGNIMLMFAAPHAPVLRRCVESFCAGASLVPENCVQIHAFGERVMGFARLREDEYAAAANRSNPGSAVQTPTTVRVVFVWGNVMTLSSLYA